MSTHPRGRIDVKPGCRLTTPETDQLQQAVSEQLAGDELAHARIRPADVQRCGVARLHVPHRYTGESETRWCDGGSNYVDAFVRDGDTQDVDLERGVYDDPRPDPDVWAIEHGFGGE